MITICAMLGCFLLGFSVGSYLTEFDNRNELKHLKTRLRNVEAMNELYDRARRDR